jgi:THO complex subunit 2
METMNNVLRDYSAPVGNKPPTEVEDGEVKDGNATANSRPAATKPKETPAARPSSSQRQAAPLVPPKTDSKSLPSRSSTPGTAPGTSIPAPGGRSEPGRPPGLTSLPGGMHGLPSRPEVPFPAHFTHDQFGTITTMHSHNHREVKDHREVRESREPRDIRDPRDARETGPRDNRDPRDSRPIRLPDDPRQRMRDYHQLPERRPLEPPPREVHRSERDRPPHRSDSVRRMEPGSQDRDLHQSRDRTTPASVNPRSTEPNKDARDASSIVKPAASSLPPESSGPPVNPERARLINAERPDDRLNPARAALLNDGRHGREDSRDRNSSRVASPRRDRAEPHNAEPSRDDRRSRVEHHSSTRDQRNESQGPATRSGRANEHEGDRPASDRGQNSSGFPVSSRNETEHGRLKNQDPEYGRLNSIPSISDMSNAPEGPRGRGRNTTRGPASGPQGRPESRLQSSDTHGPTSPERHHPPTGPSSSRPRRNQNGIQHGPAPGLPSSTGLAALPGVHPERLRQLNSGVTNNSQPSQPSYPTPMPAPASVHPDRMAQIAPQSSGGNSHPGGRSLPPIQTPDRPSVGSMPSHRPLPSNLPPTPGTDNSPVSAPTGPAAANDRSRNGRRQLSGINSILQGGPAVRPRTSRTNLAGSDAQVLTGASPVSTPVSERPEPFPSAKERSSRSDHERGRREHEGGSDRSARPSRRGGSRDRSPDRDHRSTKDHRDYGERKSGSGASSHRREGDKDSGRRSGRESNAGRDPLPSRNEVIGNGRDGPRELRHRGDGGNSRHEEMGRGGSGRGGGERRDARDEQRGSNRKRRSEDFGGGGPVEKRQRR